MVDDSGPGKFRLRFPSSCKEGESYPSGLPKYLNLLAFRFTEIAIRDFASGCLGCFGAVVLLPEEEY